MCMCTPSIAFVATFEGHPAAINMFTLTTSAADCSTSLNRLNMVVAAAVRWRSNCARRLHKNMHSTVVAAVADRPRPPTLLRQSICCCCSFCVGSSAEIASASLVNWRVSACETIAGSQCPDIVAEFVVFGGSVVFWGDLTQNGQMWRTALFRVLICDDEAIDGREHNKRADEMASTEDDTKNMHDKRWPAQGRSRLVFRNDVARSGCE